MAAHYDDTNYSYEKYWNDRKYEHASEVIAIENMLSGTKVGSAADIGGGFGRLTPLLATHARTAYLIEPSRKQRSISDKYIPEEKKYQVQSGTIEKTGLADSSLDLALVVRVMHHLPNPKKAFLELERVVKPGGLLLLEFANSLNFKSRLASLLSGQPILPSPIEKRSNTNIRKNTIPFVNHHPDTILKLMRAHHFQPQKALSVSNFRSPFLKKYLSQKALLDLESISQKPLASLYFGPSIFILAKRVDN